ncbi:MAG TPA: hypothetical protein VH593_34045 [Ktedonobacteraceae bacterium]
MLPCCVKREEAARGAEVLLFYKRTLGNNRLQPIGQIDEFHAARQLRGIEGVAHDDLAQFCRRIQIAKQAIEPVQKALNILMGTACRTGAIRLEQAFTPGRAQCTCGIHRSCSSGRVEQQQMTVAREAA